MSQKAIGDLATQFILYYLNHIRHRASMIPKSDWGLFPFYWFKSSKVTIFITIGNELAISIDRILKGKEDKITIRKTWDRIEETHFPNLDYANWPLFRIPENGHDIVIKGGTLDVGTHPVIALSSGADVRILQARIEASVKGYPREKMFLWFLTSPNKKYLSKDKAELEAELDFWGGLESLVLTKLDYLLSRRVEEETVSLLQKSLERLRQEYLKLISRQDLDEPTLQYFLEEHYFLLSPGNIPKKEKRKLGPYIPDFILRYEDNALTLVEIQLNRDPIIQNNQASSGLKEAIKQLKDWFKWIDSNQHSMLSRYRGLIVIGRRESYQKSERIIKFFLSKIGYPVKLLTYDDLENSIDFILSQLVKTKKYAHSS